MRDRALTVHLALVFVQVTFGAFPVVGKAVLVHLPPLALAAVRVLVSTPLLLVLAWRFERVRPSRRDWPALALLGILGVFLNQVLFIFGLQLTSATNAAILMPSIPVFTAAAAAALGVQRPDSWTIGGVLLAGAGALTVLDPGRWSASGQALWGDLLILGNCLAYAVYLVLQRPVLRRLPPLTVVAWAFLIGGAATVAVGAPSLLDGSVSTLPPTAWIGLTYIVLIPTAVNYALNSWALRRSSPALVAAYTCLQPVAAAALAIGFLGEELGAMQAIGFVLIASGLALVSRRSVAGGLRASTLAADHGADA
jgi:drug/metabolite transporter (DMT)-like permease